MRGETPSAVIGNSGDPALDWQLFGIGQTGQLAIANRNAADSFEIITLCEKRDRKAYQQVTDPWFVFWR